MLAAEAGCSGRFPIPLFHPHFVKGIKHHVAASPVWSWQIVTPPTGEKGGGLGYSGENPRSGVFPVLPIFLTAGCLQLLSQFLRLSFCFQSSKEGISGVFVGLCLTRDAGAGWKWKQANLNAAKSSWKWEWEVFFWVTWTAGGNDPIHSVYKTECWIKWSYYGKCRGQKT